MTPPYDWAKKSERVNDYVPDVRFERTSIIATLSKSDVNTEFMYKGTLNGELFEAYAEQKLAPTLGNNDILILDNYSVHKMKNILNPLIENGAEIVFLPPYSPDLNPIELMWNKVKTILRKIKVRTYDKLVEALKVALDSISVSDITNWFEHDGYKTI